MKRCSKCGEEKEITQFHKEKTGRDGHSSHCKACRCEYQKQRYQANREARLEYDKQYRQDNKEHRNQYSKQYYKNNKEYWKQYSKQYYKQYYKNNAEVYKKNARKRRAMKQAVNENYTPQDEAYTRQLFGHMCFNCKATDNLHIDHHYPLSKGFPLTRDNAVLLCKSCNTSKHTKMPEEFYTELQCHQLDYMLSF